MTHTHNGLPAAHAADTGHPALDLGQLRATVDHLPLLAWSCRPDGYCDYLSRRWVEYTGVPEADHHGRGWLDAVHPDDRARTRDGWDGFVAGTGPYDVDYRLRRHDGVYRWFKTRGVLVRGADGAPLRVLGTTTDVDDQKRAEERDREARERLGAALAASGTGTFRWDIVTNALDWDAQLDQLFGLPPGQTVRSLEKFVELVHPDDRAGVVERCRRCKETGADFAMEFRVVWPDGSVRWLDDRGRTFRDAAGRPAYMTGACVDVTERKRAEEQIRQADERAGFVRRASGVGFWYCDLPFDVLEWDERVKEHFHLPPDARVTIDTFYERMHPDDREPTRRAVERSIADRGQYDVHYRTVDPATGAEKWVRAIGRTSYAADGTPRRFDGLTLDVTRQRRAEGQQRFLADLAAATQPLADPDRVTATAARLLAEYLGCDRCAYAEVEDEAVYVITGDHTRGVPSIVGRWPVAAFGAEHLRMMRADEPYVVDDADADPRITPADLAAYRATTIRAVVCVPLHKGGRFTAAMAVHQAAPRRWTAGEVDLVRAVVGRCWEALERARVERSLREREEQFRSLFVSMDEGYCVVEPVFDESGRAVDYRYLLANPALEYHTGLKDVVGKTAREMMPHHESLWIEAYARVAATGEPFRRTDRVADLGRWFEVSAFRVGAGRVGILFADVTARVEAQELLRASEERFRAFMDHSPAAAWVTDRDGRVRYVSATYHRLFALPDRELVGAVPADLYPEEFAGAYVANIRTVADSGTALETVEQAPRPDGSVGEFLVYKFPLPGGEWVGGVAVDVTERLRAEEQLREADRRKDEFLATLAHELRNPLAPIRNGLQILQLAPDSPQAAADVLAMMERQLGQLVHLVDDLLDLSRISRGKVELRRERLDLARAVRHAVETSRPALERAGHDFAVTLPPDPVYVDADLTRLTQVFSNLLNNAAKYTEPGGRIRLAVSRDDREAVVSVADNGVGIPATMLPKVFDMFAQVDRHLERSQGGLGIGLSIVKRLVEMHGGTVEVSSGGHGKGSEFVVRLPVVGEPGSRPRPAEDRAAAAAGCRVLVVDDNRDAASSLAVMLRLMGNEVETAFDALQGLAVAPRFRPDVVLLDIGMPRMNGYDAARRIREQVWGRSVVLVALTGWGQDEDRRKSQEAGFDHHLTKPVDPAHLENLLADLARLRGDPRCGTHRG